MENKNIQQTTFWKFLQDHKIEIPIIQRDYAQGRIGKERLREKFLADLKGILDRHSEENKEILKLDFVYGSVENNKLNPLDGQQRLTTLWLLHWFIAHKAGKLKENKLPFKNFSYETRVSSHDFCERLSDFYTRFDEKINIVESIQNQTWFLSSWKQDPTVQSMLNMLGGTAIKNNEQNEIIDGLEEVFKNCNESDFVNYWEKLTVNCPIIFYYLDLQGLRLSDDLYIKMNARGKHLTSFENFKADLVGYIIEKEENGKRGKSKTPQASIAHKLDVDWTNIFWKNKSPDGYKIDEIYFAFINRFLLNALITARTSEKQENIEKEELFVHLYKDVASEYNNFGIYQKESSFCDAIDMLEKTLDNFYKFIGFEENKEDLNKSLFYPPWNKESNFCFIPEYINKEKGEYIVSPITQSQRVVFYAICCYFKEGEYEKTSLKNWMRIVWNIVENGNINTISSMVGAMHLINELAEDSHNIYDHLLKERDISSDFAKEQMAEEKEKARQIKDGGSDWEEKIEKAEKTAFFKGAIRFLYRTDDDKNSDWNLFDIRYAKAKEYFDENGVKDSSDENGPKYKTDALLLKAFVSRVENPLDYLWYKDVFDNKNNTWKALLIKSGLRSIMNIILSGDISIADMGKEKWHKKLYKTNLLSYVAKNLDGAQIRKFNRNGHIHIAIYPPRYTGVILDMDNRDELLSALLDKKSIYLLSEKCRIPENAHSQHTNLFYGWNINFQYNGCNFQWDFKNNIHLLNQKQEQVVGSSFSMENETSDTSESFLEKLNKLANINK